MGDPRVEQLAEVLVHHSIQVKKGENVLIIGSPEAAPLVKEIYRRVLRAGAHPVSQVELPELGRIFFDEANEEQLVNIDFVQMLYKHADALIRIQSTNNTKDLTGVDPKRMQLRRKASQPLMEHVMQGGMRWVLTLYPTLAYAQEAEMSLEEYEDFVFSATNVDYAELEKRMKRAASRFDRAKKVRIVGKDTDLTVDIEGRKAVICAGEHNVPDGEFFYTPNHLLTEGTIYYDWPTVFSGREIRGIRLRFAEGKVVECSAEKGQEFLEQALDTDEGARYLGELGIGANFGISRPTKDILFDEKIGGSVHLALGRAYDEAGKGNESAIHWDMVKNLRDGGEIYLDGKLAQRNGEWQF